MEIKITAIKFEIVNGKKTGRSLTFKLDPKKMAAYKTEATLRKKIDEFVIKTKIFKKNELPNVKYDMKEFISEWKKQLPVVEEESKMQQEISENKTRDRVTPEQINRLASNEIFVFGSNSQGMHYGGAAKTAVERFGAVMGQGHGLQGKSYAIDTMSGINAMIKDISDFYEFAKDNPKKHFLVTPIGCGIAGYSSLEIAPLFEKCKDLSNVSLPKSFWKVLNEAGV